jgi:uncharacterized protein (TIGR03437 family)
MIPSMSEMMKRQTLLFVVLTVISLVAGPRAWATTLLTSEVPVNFGLPSADKPILFNGEIGYAIYVPPGAQRLTIRYLALTPGQVMQVLVRHGADVGLSGLGNLVRDHVLAEVSPAVQEVVIHPQSSPPLRSGLYYIAFYLRESPTLMDGQITATVEGGSAAPTRSVAVSSFEKDLDGWTRRGDPDAQMLWISSGGNPAGYIRYEEFGGGDLDALIAPAKFHGNLGALQGPRFELDFKQLAGPLVQFPVEIRITGAGTVFSWQGSTPLPPPDELDYPPPSSFPPLLNPPADPPEFPRLNRWFHYVAPLQLGLWTRVSGEARFAPVLANVERVELITDLVVSGEAHALDNFALVAEGDGPPPVVLAGNTGFSGGPDGWGRNYPASELSGTTAGDKDSTFRWVPFEGNPNGYIRLNDAGGAARDYLVVPERFLGDFRQIPNAQIEFDYYHASQRGASLPVEVRLVASDAVFAWTGAVPGRMWTHFAAPLAESNWRRESGTGTFASTLANIRRIEISMDQAEGPEWNGIDNFWVLTASTTPAPPALSANPQSIAFTAVARGANPVAQSLGVTSMGGGSALSFTAASSAGWLKLSGSNGTTPRSLNIWPDIAGLAEGSYSARVTVTPLGGSLAPRTVTVNLTVTSRPGGIPRISSGGIINAANGRRQLSPGALGSIYGENFGPATPVLAAFVPNTSVLPTKLQGIRVLVQETYGAVIAEAPLLYVSRNQINFQLPYECFGRAEVLIVVDAGGALSDPQAVQVISSAPGIFTWGEGRAVAVNQDGVVNSTENAASRGSVLTVYLTGQGVITPPLPSGAAATSRPLVRTPLPVKAWVGHAPAQVLFAGMVPGLVGVTQINLLVPEAAPAGETQLLFNIDGWTSNFAAVSIR